jgi:hypothetical protein
LRRLPSPCSGHVRALTFNLPPMYITRIALTRQLRSFIPNSCSMKFYPTYHDSLTHETPFEPPRVCTNHLPVEPVDLHMTGGRPSANLSAPARSSVAKTQVSYTYARSQAAIAVAVATEHLFSSQSATGNNTSTHSRCCTSKRLEARGCFSPCLARCPELV